MHDQAPYRPYYYNLGDETGIADLAAAWDFDFSPAALSTFRVWLHSQYASLTALNAEWGSHFATWDTVLPPTTTAAKQASNENFAAWNNFKAFMDSAFADALRAGTDAVHQADPTAKAAIEGAQIPGWGGYDYTKLSHAVDVMETFDAGNNVEIAHALNPALTLLSTSGGSGAGEQHRIWHELLQGERGLVVWDEDGSIVAPKGTPGPRGLAESATFNELRGGLGALLIARRTQPGPVGILYSAASFRLRWTLDHRADGDAWGQRGSEREGEDNATRLAMRRAAATLVHAGLQPSWLSHAMIAAGALRHGLRAVVLPDSLALSPAESAKIRQFRARGGLVLADGAPGIFAQHGRRLPKPA
ncbi:MAG TPA: beta-galactosidase, partial [Acetobacteraceae bacterium]